jgi:centromere/kinetochore protein ZW10
MSTIPCTAAVLHNDCVFFAHHLLCLGNQFRAKFPPLKEGGDVHGNVLWQMCTFVDLVPPFWSPADKALGDMIERQKYQLMDIVASRLEMLGKAVESNENVTEWTDAETALTAGLYHLRHIAQA